MSAQVPPVTPGHPDRLLVVDALRGVAALMVLFLHLPEVSGVLLPLRPLQAVGHTGVGLFLVLSGFSIHYRWAQQRGQGSFDRRRFWHRRIWRLYPTYVAAVIATVAIVAIIGDLPSHVPWQFSEQNEPWAVLILAQITLVTANFITVPFVGVAWSLALEAQLYAAYAALITRLHRIGIWQIIALSLGIAIIWRVGAQVVTPSVPVGQFLADGSASYESRVLYAQLPARWFEWMLGVLVAEMCCGNISRPTPRRALVTAGAVLVCAAILFRVQQGQLELNGHTFFASDVLLDPLFGIGYAALLVGAVTMPSTVAQHLAIVIRPLAAVGLFSYSLYLLHPALVGLADRLIPTDLPAAAREIGQALCGVAGAWLFFQLVERHFLFPRGGAKRRATLAHPTEREEQPLASAPPSH